MLQLFILFREFIIGSASQIYRYITSFKVLSMKQTRIFRGREPISVQFKIKSSLLLFLMNVTYVSIIYYV